MRTSAALVAAIALAVAADVLCAAVAGAGNPPPLALTLSSSAATYAAGPPIAFSLTVQNTSLAPITVATTNIGVIQIGPLRRNGKSVPATVNSVDFIQPPAESQVGSLATLSPGASVDIPFRVRRDANGGQYVTDYKLNKRGTKNLERLFPVSAVGSYQLSVRYHYTGLPGSQSDVFRGTIKSNEVTFNVQ